MPNTPPDAALSRSARPPPDTSAQLVQGRMVTVFRLGHLMRSFSSQTRVRVNDRVLRRSRRVPGPVSGLRTLELRVLDHQYYIRDSWSANSWCLFP